MAKGTRGLVALTVVAVLLILAGGWFLAVSPVREATAAAEAETQQVEAQNAVLAARNAELAAHAAKLPEYREELAGWRQGIPPAPEQTEFLRQVNDIATATPLTHLPLVILLSLLVSYSVVFAAGFSGEQKRHLRTAPGLNAFSETVVAYCVALVVAFAVLWIFGRIGPDMMWLEMYTKTVLLAFPASMAASAGRLAV